jgi:hypothetical protein
MKIRISIPRSSLRPVTKPQRTSLGFSRYGVMTSSHTCGQFQETPARYELKDKKGSLINFDYSDGLYTVPKELEHGYLCVLHFGDFPDLDRKRAVEDRVCHCSGGTHTSR